MTRGWYAYVAGPLTGDTPENVRLAALAGQAIRDAGGFEFVPHDSVFRHQATPRSWGAWVDWCLGWVDRCDVVVRLPGESKGADLEVQHAKLHGVPVVFLRGTAPELLREGADAARRLATSAASKRPEIPSRDESARMIEQNADRVLQLGRPEPPPVPEAWTERDDDPEPDAGKRVQAKVVGQVLRDLERLTSRVLGADAEAEQLAEQVGGMVVDLEALDARVRQLEDEPADLAGRLQALERHAEREREAGAAALLARVKLLEHGHKAMHEQLRRLRLGVGPRG